MILKNANKDWKSIIINDLKKNHKN